MDKWQAIHNLWSSFGLAAYDENSVPDDAQYPYITYSSAISDFEDPVILTASIWYRTTSWAEASQKAVYISRMVSPYKMIPVDGGYLYVVKGTPFAQRMRDEDDLIKRIYIVLQAEFFTNY